MDRRNLMTAFAGSAVGLSILGQSILGEEPSPTMQDIHRITPNSETNLAVQSTAVVDGDRKLNLISLGTCSLNLDDHGRLTALVKAAVKQYAKVDYWISLAVFDEKLRFLGAATHKEAIEYIRLGVMRTSLLQLEFDFGISNRFRTVTQIAVAISERDVPKPD